MESAEPDPSPAPGAVGMCYVVVTADEPGLAPDDLRIRFEFRDDLTSGHSESRTVLVDNQSVNSVSYERSY